MTEAAVTFILRENLPRVLVAEEPGGVTLGTSGRGTFSPLGVILLNESLFLTAWGRESFTCLQEVRGQSTLGPLQKRVL